VRRLTLDFSPDQNAPPKANAGGDFKATLPISVLKLNGSRSSDDLAVVKWKWSRDESSLAQGTVLDNTDTSPILMVILFHYLVAT
jgi:dyslexia-associated protein KIAA0319-like protein